MALMQVTYFSAVLKRTSGFLVTLPDAAVYGEQASFTPGTRFQTLTLLHGLSDNHTDWLRRSNIERHAVARNLAVIMPDAGRSFYTDMAHGDAWWTCLTEEIPRVARMYFPLSDRRTDNFVAGLSMGGYGALKMALRLPERFAAAASLSGALDLQSLLGQHPSQTDPLHLAGELLFENPGDIAAVDADLYALVRKADPKALPQLRLYCGDRDGLLEHSERFAALCAQHGIETNGVAVTPGAHTWPYWDTTIQQALDDFPLAGKPVPPA